MRRNSPAAGLTPQLIKQFAIVTVMVTAAIAVVADGRGRDAGEAVKATIANREARNQQLAAEARALGARHLGVSMNERKAREDPAAGTPVDESGSSAEESAGSASIGGGASYARTSGNAPVVPPRLALPKNAGESITYTNVTADQLPMPPQGKDVTGKSAAGKGRTSAPTGPVSAKQAAAIEAASRARSGSATSAD